MINVHASLLPRWRGAAPIIYAMKEGDKKTGVSIMRILPNHFDIGEILAQTEVLIPPRILMPELHTKLADEGAKLLLKCVQDIPSYLKNARPQSDVGVTYAPKVVADLTRIDWTIMSAKSIFNLYRGLYSYKYVTCSFSGHLVKLINVDYDDEGTIAAAAKDCDSPGYFHFSKSEKCLIVNCTTGFIKIHSIQVEGKRIMTSLEFLNGFVKKKSKDQHYFV